MKVGAMNGRAFINLDNSSNGHPSYLSSKTLTAQNLFMPRSNQFQQLPDSVTLSNGNGNGSLPSLEENGGNGNGNGNGAPVIAGITIPWWGWLIIGFIGGKIL